MKRYIYKDKITGLKVTSDEQLNDSNLLLISKFTNAKMKSNDSRVVLKEGIIKRHE